MGRKRKPKPDDPEQYPRFVEAAKKVETEDTKKRFEEVLKRILVAKSKAKNKG